MPCPYTSSPFHSWVTDLEARKKQESEETNLSLSTPKYELGPIHARNIATLGKLTEVSFPVSYGEQFYLDVVGFNVFSRYLYVSDVAVGGISGRLQRHCDPVGEKKGDITGEEEVHLFRKEDVEEWKTEKTLYITTLAVLPAYRRRKLANALLTWLKSAVQKWNDYQVPVDVKIPEDTAAPTEALETNADSTKKDSSAVVASTVTEANTNSALLQAHTESLTAKFKSSPKVARNDIRRIALHVQTSNAGALKFYEQSGFVRRGLVRNYYPRLEDCKDAWYMCMEVE